MSKEVYIVSAARTAIGNFCGSLADLSAVDLGIIAAKEAIKRANITPDMIDEIYIGNVLSAGLGQGVARQISIGSEIPARTPAMTLNMICGSGLRSVSLAAQLIKTGDADLILAGGAESMSNAAYVLPKVRNGLRMGNGEIVDTMIKDGLTDAFSGIHMGITAENLAEKYGITREEQDAFAANSQNKAELAITIGKFKDEIVPVEIPQRKGDPIIFDRDEFPRAGVTAEGLGKLRPVFKKDGTVTAANASGLNDGAAMLILASKEKCEELGLKPMAKIVSYASCGVDPEVMGYGVVPATEKALEIAGKKIEEIDLIESNEAFAAQALAVIKGLGIRDTSNINVNGGALALGHPIGASGARILTTLLYEMQRTEARSGLATLCIGGGMGTSLIVEKL